MEKLYELSAQALIGTASMLGKEVFIGVENVAEGMSDEECQEFANQVLKEFTQMGVAQMDFDGNYSLDPDFHMTMLSILESPNIVGMEIMREKNAAEKTLYFAKNRCYLSERPESGLYTIYAVEKEEIEEILSCQGEFDSRDVLTGNFSVENGTKLDDKKALEEAGCPAALAAIIQEAAAGKTAMIKLNMIAGDETAANTYLPQKDGILEVTVIYDNFTEMLHFEVRPSSQIKEEMKALADRMWVNG